MPTTSLKLSDELKKRAAAAAQKLGVSTHAFMLNAIEHATTVTEQRTRFLEEARTTRDTMVDTGQGFDAVEVHPYLKARVTGNKKPRPKARAWRG